MKQYSKPASATLLLCLAIAQLIRPVTDNPPVNPARSLWRDPRVDPRAASILKRACANCHSYETVWPWYSRISPASWIIARDVSRGRGKLNFSEWCHASANQLQEICDELDKDAMPPKNYRLLHPEARLSKADLEILIDWTQNTAVRGR